MKTVNYFLFLLLTLPSTVLAATTYYLIDSESKLDAPKRIYWSEAKKFKGHSFALKFVTTGDYTTYIFPQFHLLKSFIVNQGLATANDFDKSNEIIQISMELMKKQKEEVASLRQNQNNQTEFFDEYERFINSDAYWFYTGSPQTLNGYISGGTGINFCSGMFDMNWGMDCSGFAYLAHRLNKSCFPRFRSANLWTLYDSKFDDRDHAYTRSTLQEFFEVVPNPRPGDFVLYDGHISIYFGGELAIGQSSWGITFEVYKHRNPTSDNKNGVMPHFIFVRTKDAKSNLCEQIKVDNYIRSDYSGSDKQYSKLFQGLFFNRDENSSNIFLKDYTGAGSGATWCQESNYISNDSIYPEIEQLAKVGRFVGENNGNSLCEPTEFLSGVKFNDQGDKSTIGIYCQQHSFGELTSPVSYVPFLLNSSLEDIYQCPQGEYVIGVSYDPTNTADLKIKGIYCRGISFSSSTPESILVSNEPGEFYGKWCEINQGISRVGFKSQGDHHITQITCGTSTNTDPTDPTDPMFTIRYIQMYNRPDLTSKNNEFHCQDHEIVMGIKFSTEGDHKTIGFYCGNPPITFTGPEEFIQHNNLPGKYYDTACPKNNQVITGFYFRSYPPGDSYLKGYYCRETNKTYTSSKQVIPVNKTGVEELMIPNDSVMTGFHFKDSGDDHIREIHYKK